MSAKGQYKTLTATLVFMSNKPQFEPFLHMYVIDTDSIFGNSPRWSHSKLRRKNNEALSPPAPQLLEKMLTYGCIFPLNKDTEMERIRVAKWPKFIAYINNRV